MHNDTVFSLHNAPTPAAFMFPMEKPNASFVIFE